MIHFCSRYLWGVSLPVLALMGGLINVAPADGIGNGSDRAKIEKKLAPGHQRGSRFQQFADTLFAAAGMRDPISASQAPPTLVGANESGARAWPVRAKGQSAEPRGATQASRAGTARTAATSNLAQASAPAGRPVPSATSAQTPLGGRAPGQPCTAEEVAGSYVVQAGPGYGPLVCKAVGDALDCCYGRKCENTAKLALDQSRNAVGTWMNQRSGGPAVFPISSECALESGRWNGEGREPKLGWVLRGRVNARADSQNRASRRRPVDGPSESNTSSQNHIPKVMATFRKSASWGRHTTVEAAAQVRLLGNGDGEMRIEVTPSSSAFKFFAEPHAAVLVADRNGRVISSRTITELAMSMGSDINRMHGVRKQVIPSGEFQDGAFAFFRLKFCAWQMNFARTVQASNGCYKSSIRNELRQFTDQLPSKIGEVRGETGRSFELLNWQGIRLR